MKVLMVSGDKKILEEGSDAHARLLLQKTQVDELDVFVWPRVHSYRDIMRAAGTGRYDVVTAQDPFWRGLVAWRAAQIASAKLNIQVHTDLSAQTLLRRALATFVLMRADSVRVVSEKIRDDLAALHLRAPLTVLPIFIDLAPFQGLVHVPHARFKKVILWIGRFEQEKDPLFALAILKEVRAQGIDAGLVLLGAGSLEKELRAEAESLAPYVKFPGWQSPAPDLAMADVVVSTSEHESYGASIIEALATDVPVVSPDYGIAREAGAVIAEKSKLGEEVIKVLQSGERGVLKISLPTAEAWAKAWRASLV